LAILRLDLIFRGLVCAHRIKCKDDIVGVADWWYEFECGGSAATLKFILKIHTENDQSRQMKLKRLIAFFSTLLFTLVLAVSCNQPVVTRSSTTLLVGAAASLQDAIATITPQFTKAHPSIKVDYAFAASGALQMQIEQGAPIDVFISAATQQMDALQQKGLISDTTRHTLLSNQLVLVVPQDSTLKLTNFQQLINPDIQRISVGEPRSVPAGQYAEEVLSNLNLWQQLQPKFVYGNSVRNVLATVESGNADAGIVYLTDAKTSDRIKQVAVAPNHLHKPIVYPIAVLKASSQQQAAQLYVEFLISRPAQALFQQYGFGTVQ
jgi:molybdate transport system substrate-binding protein